MNPRVNIVDGKLERLYISSYSDEFKKGKLMLVYRPTHEFMGMYSPAEIIKLWNMDKKSFYAMVTRNIYFRVPKSGNYDFMVSGHYASCEDSYERIYLNVTEQFIGKYNLPRLYESIPYEYLAKLKRERITRGGNNLKCEFNETQSFTMEGPYADWAREFIDVIYNFDGHTKLELFKALREYVDVTCFLDVLSIFKNNGISGIAELKQTGRKDLTKMLVNRINSWKLVW